LCRNRQQLMLLLSSKSLVLLLKAAALCCDMLRSMKLCYFQICCEISGMLLQAYEGKPG
jgi:hypothetical protein